MDLRNLLLYPWIRTKLKGRYQRNIHYTYLRGVYFVCLITPNTDIYSLQINHFRRDAKVFSLNLSFYLMAENCGETRIVHTRCGDIP